MKKLLLTILLILSIIFTAFTQQPKYLFKIATEAPKGSLWYNVIQSINKELYYATNKNVGIITYHGGVMGDQATIIKKIKIGQLNGGTFSGSGLQMIYKDFAIAGFPLVIRNEKEYDYFKQKLSPFFEEKFKQNGFVVLGWSETGPVYVYSKKKVNSLNTLKSSKPFVLEGDTTSLALFKEVDANPIHLQIADILTSLQTGQIDTVFSPPYALIATQWYSKVYYMADFPIGFMVGSVAVDRKTFESMPAEYQQTMKKLFKKHFDNTTPKIRQDNKNAVATLKKFGIKVLEVPDDQKQVFYDVCNKVSQHLLANEGYSKDVYRRVISTLEEIR
ncbi:MAG: TRAP transporter substrate-binding protein DctP [Spirochaetes bacterium]|nr:TRAP transporter substrate-binding protein DctP [Spirochaetota bacterium]